MNDYKKAIVLVAVIFLLAMPFAAFSADADQGQVTKKSDTYVFINVNGTFDDNKEELKKLGIEDPSAWTYNTEYDSYQLELKNVNFETTCAYGVILYSEGDIGGLALKLTGENSIKSGSVFPEEYVKEAVTLWGWNTHIAIIGDGSLTVKCDCTNPDSLGSAAIWAEQFLIIEKGAKVHTETTDFVHECKGLRPATDTAEIYSIGVYAWAIWVVSSPSGPYSELTSYSGNISVKYTGTSTAVTENIYSFGISCVRLVGEYSTIRGQAGAADYTVSSEGATSDIVCSYSQGINMTEGSDIKPYAYYSFAEFSHCKVFGFSDDVVGKDRGTSKGVTMRSDDNITIRDSIVITGSGDARATSPDNSLTTAYGLEFYSVTEVYDSLIVSVGNSVSGATVNFSLGLHGKKDMTFNGSTVMVQGKNVGLCTIKKFGTQDFNHLTINDSDIIAQGDVRAMNGDPAKIRFVSSWNTFVGLDRNGKAHELSTAADIISTNYNIVQLAYKYSVIVSYKSGSIDTFQRYDSKYITIPSYDNSYLPEGKIFSKWHLNDDEVYVGQLVKLNNFSYLKAELKDAPTNGDLTVTIAAVAVAIIALVLLAMIFVKR